MFNRRIGKNGNCKKGKFSVSDVEVHKQKEEMVASPDCRTAASRRNPHHICAVISTFAVHLRNVLKKNIFYLEYFSDYHVSAALNCFYSIKQSF